MLFSFTLTSVQKRYIKHELDLTKGDMSVFGWDVFLQVKSLVLAKLIFMTC